MQLTFRTATNGVMIIILLVVLLIIAYVALNNFKTTVPMSNDIKSSDVTEKQVEMPIESNSRPIFTSQDDYLKNRDSVEYAVERVEAKEVKQSESKPVRITIQQPPEHNVYRTSESKEVAFTEEGPGLVNQITLSTLADIYTFFPFLSSEEPTTETLAFHADLVMRLGFGEGYRVISGLPDAAKVKAWEDAYAHLQQQTLEQFRQGPNPVVAQTDSGNINFARLAQVPNFSKVHNPQQTNKTLIFFVQQNNKQALPIKVVYTIGQTSVPAEFDVHGL